MNKTTTRRGPRRLSRKQLADELARLSADPANDWLTKLDAPPGLFDTARLYSLPVIAKVAGRTTRSLFTWRQRGLLPAPDALLGGRFPAWRGATLNCAAAFARPATGRDVPTGA